MMTYSSQQSSRSPSPVDEEVRDRLAAPLQDRIIRCPASMRVEARVPTSPVESMSPIQAWKVDTEVMKAWRRSDKEGLVRAIGRRRVNFVPKGRFMLGGGQGAGHGRNEVCFDTGNVKEEKAEAEIEVIKHDSQATRTLSGMDGCQFTTRTNSAAHNGIRT
ncbi:Hypothetical protein D9617_4g004060 [Elsinoe fawcettii]|nr:Hypothetical protein D9617_4g004060 [Elsinoe fawcettii]